MSASHAFDAVQKHTVNMTQKQHVLKTFFDTMRMTLHHTSITAQGITTQPGQQRYHPNNMCTTHNNNSISSYRGTFCFCRQFLRVLVVFL